MTLLKISRIFQVFLFFIVTHPTWSPSVFATDSPVKDKPHPSTSLPFPDGETMSFEVRWDSPAWLFFLPSMQAGEITFEAHLTDSAEPGQKFWRLIGQARSSGTLASLTGLNVQDDFESWMDAKEFCSRQILKKIREGSRHRDVETQFFCDQGCLYHLETDPRQSPPKVIRSQEIVGIPSCVQDVISIFYAIRIQSLEVGKRYSLSVSDNGRTKTIQGFIEREETVKTNIGILPTYKIRTESLFGGLFREGGEFFIWLHKENKYPVRFEAKVKLGKIFGRITSYNPGKTVSVKP
jgi:hypothetical protein